MIQKVIEAFTTKLCDPDQFCWIERYGGLARTVKQPSQDKKNCKFPVSCTVKNKECWESELYLNLVPNENYKSIVYFEEVGTAKPIEQVKGATKFRQKIRLVIWVNMTQLGYDQCSIMPMLLPQLIQCFHCKNWKSEVMGVDKITTVVSDILGASETILKVFSKYNYESDCYSLYPYEVGAIDIFVDYLIDPNCFDPVDVIECKEPIECLNFGGE